MINRYFAAITGTSTKNYIIGKIFEISVVGTLLLVNSEAVPILAHLNFFENVHYVTYNKTNMETIFADVLSKKSFEKYAKNSMDWTANCAWISHDSTSSFVFTQLGYQQLPLWLILLFFLHYEKHFIFNDNIKIFD